MRLPQPLLESVCFSLASGKEVCAALGEPRLNSEKAEHRNILRLAAKRLPPITSERALAVMLGINMGLIWSITRNTRRYYREFKIRKKKGYRQISAPRVALKVIQKWMSVHLERAYSAPDHVYGFVKGRSHLQAAQCHSNARWVLSLDIQDFFPSTPLQVVVTELQRLGYGKEGSQLVASLSCLNGFLAQGSPASPVLSNIAFAKVDKKLAKLSEKYEVRLTRYADDITFSGTGEFPKKLLADVRKTFSQLPWKLARTKTQLSVVPMRLKVHGLLVSGDVVRLTKGYRNRIRAYRHLIKKRGGIRKSDLKSVEGHLMYASQVEEFLSRD